MAMAPALGFCRPRTREFPASRSLFFRALALRPRRPFSRRHLRPRQAHVAAALEHSITELRGPKRKRARGPRKRRLGGGRRQRSSAAGAPPDLLSGLPDCLLHAIMSFMKARQVAQTCVLSRRWRHLWLAAPCLDVDVHEFKPTTTVPPMSWKERGRFVDFAANLVRRCNLALLDSLTLRGHGDCTPLLFLRHAARISGQMESLLSSSRLTTPTTSTMMGCSSWRRLRRLQLTHVPLDDNCFATHFGNNSGCQHLHLEELFLEECTLEVRSVVFASLKTLIVKQCRWGELSEIASPTLKTLVILCDLPYNPLVISAPAVAHLHLAVKVDSFSAGVSVKEMPSLDKAMIQLFGNRLFYASDTPDDGDRFRFLHSVSNVTNLELCSVGTGSMVLGKEPTSKEFLNLKNLVLFGCDLSDDRILEFFLQRSPNLEKLTLQHCELSDDTEVKPVLRLKMTDFLRESLKFEIVYREHYTHQLVEFMMRVSEYRSENYIKLLGHVDFTCTDAHYKLP